MLNVGNALRAAVPLTFLALNACNYGCTLIGCADGLRVNLASMPVGAFQVELFVDGVLQPAPPEATCDGVTQCSQSITFQTRATNKVSVHVTTVAGTRITNLAPVSYAKSQPNGKGCDPTCYNAAATVPLP